MFINFLNKAYYLGLKKAVRIVLFFWIPPLDLSHAFNRTREKLATVRAKKISV